MKHVHRSRSKVVSALLALPVMLTVFLFTPVQATQRMVLIEEWENTS